MSWLFSRALVAEYSAASCSGGEPSALLSANPMPHAFLPSDRMTAFSRPSRFGMTFAPSTDALGAGLLMWFLEVSRARTLASPAVEQELKASGPACGDRWRELSVRYDRDSCSWRTHRSLWEEDLPWSWVTLPKWGSMRDGVLSELLTLEPPTAANDAGFSETFPTPNCYDAIPDYGNRKDNNLEEGGRHGVSLRHLVKTWPTPAARDYRHPNAKTYSERGGGTKGEQLPNAVGGALNPTWVEWLMGWPLGWTDLRPLATDRCRNAQRRHGGF